MSSAVLSPLGAHNGQRRLKTLKELQAKDKRTLLEEKDQVAGKTARSAGNGDKENDGARGPVAPNAVAIQTAENFVTAKSLEEALESIDVKAEGNPAATTVEDKVEDKVEGGRASRGAGEVCDQVLRLQDASGDVPYLDFGVVELGGSKTVLFQVLNDSFDRQRLQLDRMPTEKGFALTEGPSEASSGMQVEQDEDDYDGTYYFEAQGRAQIGVRWSPTELGTTREIIHFKLRSDRQRLQCIVFGRCVGKGEALEAKHQKKKRFLAGSGKRLAHNIQKTKKHKVGGGKEGAKQAVRSRPGFTAFHTDLWRQKQERAFAAWLNMVFLAQITCCAVKNRVRAWNDCQFDAKVQNKLWDYYTKNETLKRAMLNVEKLIDSGKLALTEKGSSLFTDLRIKKQAVSAIMSYNSFWLKQGLQVILGAQMPMTEDYTDAQLRELVLNFLIEDQTAAKRLSTGGSQDGKLKSGYTKARAREFLKKFLLMVKLLDQLMMEEDTYDMPLLFRGKGKVKSSQSMVQSVIGESLHGEGNVLRHLKFHGYALSYEQAPLLEYNFKINNLAVDLRDGVRLSKLVDYMNDKREDLISKAKISSKSKAARMSNTEKVFAQMKKLGISLNGVLSRFGLLDLKPKDIVEGDQELTLQFLWRVMRDWQIPHLIKAPSLEVEIDRISDGKKIEDSYFDRDESLAAHAGERVINLLLKWAQTICAGHGLKIRNFTSSFADGHALCLIVNRYAPELLSLDSVQRVSAQGDDVSRNAPKSEREIEQVRSNFTVMNECLSHLGGVPRMLSFSDFDSYGPDEIAVISFLAFLASRMMKLSKEDRSALVIQRKWRDSKVPPQKPLETLKLWIKSAQVIERGWKAYLDRKFSSAEWLEKLEAATKIQRAYRTMTVVRGARKQVAQKIADVTRIQAVWRMRSIRTEHFQMQRSAQTIQAQFRAWSARKHFRDSFLIPRILYSGLVHKKALEQHRADEKKNLSAVLIQAHFRMMIQKRQRKDALNAIALIQKHMRREIVYRQMRSLHSSAVRIQSTFRSYIIRKQDRHAQSAAVKIQASFRAHRQMMQFKRDMAGVVKAQSMIRTWLVQQSIKQQGEAAVCVQKAYRTYIIRKQYQHAQSAAVKIQASFRAHRQMMQFKRDMAGVVKAQSMVRTWLVQQSIKQQGEAAVCVQKAYRTYIIRKQYQHAQSAAVKIQASFRAHRQMMQFKRTWLV
ncbi:hypothetical protein HOP50_12g66360 [Chloropicon primus]|nr:hypothetical protein HOP50_12g66360 [Chloropicon primus]